MAAMKTADEMGVVATMTPAMAAMKMMTAADEDERRTDRETRSPEPGVGWVERNVAGRRRVEEDDLARLVRCSFDDPPRAVRLAAGPSNDLLLLAGDRRRRRVDAAVRIIGRDRGRASAAALKVHLGGVGA